MSRHDRQIYFVLDLDARAIIDQVGSLTKANRVAQSYQRRNKRTTAVSDGLIFYQWDE